MKKGWTPDTEDDCWDRIFGEKEERTPYEPPELPEGVDPRIGSAALEGGERQGFRQTMDKFAAEWSSGKDAFTGDEAMRRARRAARNYHSTLEKQGK